jgi:aspartate/methionine/tyrosine aminotransferase
VGFGRRGHHNEGMKVSNRSAIAPFYAMEMGALAAAEIANGNRVLAMNVGEPAGGAPQGARQAAANSLLAHNLGYTVSAGLPALRSRIAQHYQEWYSVDVDPARVSVVAGASAGFTLAFLSAFDAGDRVGVTEPGYPCYRNTLEALGVTPVGIPIGPETGYRLTPEAVAAAGPLDGLVIASPSNPTGTVLSDDDLRALTMYCRSHGIRLIADEIYHGLTFDAPASSVLSHDPDVVVLNSFSKYFGMTGWRLGWIVAAPDLVPALDRFAQNLYICAPHIAQVAGLAAFECHDELRPRVNDIKRKRSIVLDGLHACGLTNYAPTDGAFYAYVDVSSITNDSLALTKQWLAELKLATTSGIDFDPVRGHHFVRFSYAGNEADINLAMQRLQEWMASQ